MPAQIEQSTVVIVLELIVVFGFFDIDANEIVGGARSEVFGNAILEAHQQVHEIAFNVVQIDPKVFRAAPNRPLFGHTRP